MKIATRKHRARPAPPVTLDPIVESAAQLTFAPPTSACSALDARLMAESAFDAIDQLRADSDDLHQAQSDADESQEAHEAIVAQFTDYQETLKEFLDGQSQSPGLWEAWCDHRAASPEPDNYITELDVAQHRLRLWRRQDLADYKAGRR